MGDRPIEGPEFTVLREELADLRRAGITVLRDLDLPACRQACWASGSVESNRTPDAPAIETLLRRAVEDLGTGKVGECASILLGLEPGMRGDEPHELRKSAAEVWGVGVSTFRRTPEHRVLTQLADAILRQVQLHHERVAHLDLERRVPASSRLAVEWLERFESYYRVWTPISGLAGDLCAYRSTLLEEDRPYDREPGTNGPKEPGYSQEIQADGYLSAAIFYYSAYLVGVQQNLRRHGGMWLLSDARAETELEDAIYQITWHSPNNERDDSKLRMLHNDTNGELHPFRQVIDDDRPGSLNDDWREWAAQCRCTWNSDDEVDTEHFPTHRHHTGIDSNCSLHAVVAACNTYTTLIDDDWKRIADWYRLPSLHSTMPNDRKMYDQWRAGLRE